MRGLALFAVLLFIPQASRPVSAQASDQTGGNGQTLSIPLNNLPQSAAGPTSNDYLQPRITVANPVPVPAAWTLRDQITWAANLVLVILGYVGIMLAVSTLRKIESQTRYAESVATAAADAVQSALKSVASVAAAATDAAQAALFNAEAIIHSERPWILISVEPSPGMQNNFTVVATNRGRTPAKIVATAERIKIAPDEARLPRTPEYENEGPSAPRSPIILLPGESIGIKPFSREDLKGICWSEEMLRRVENWEEKVYIYGKIIYKDLVAPPDRQNHETAWCCWYIHGRQKSGLVIAGPPDYNLHT
jgi:hypothetical protein